MSRREFHFISGASSKFWAIELKGSSFDITFGKIGTAGTTQTKSFADGPAAQKAYEKLISEKTSKGYVEVGASNAQQVGHGGGKPAQADSNELNELYFATTQNVEDIGKLNTFIGMKVVDFKSLKSVKKGDCVYRIRVAGWDDEGDDESAGGFMDRLTTFLDSDAAPSAKGLVIGNWSTDGPEPIKPIIETLVSQKDRLPNLIAIFLGDISSEENEISWIEQTDLSPLLKAFTQLQLLRVRGGTQLEFKSVKHDTLRALAVEAGGLAREVVGQICKAKLPDLEYLELWLGTEGYGGTTRVNDLQPILKGTTFPKLKYLGLRNSEIVDEIAAVIINSPVIHLLETLDLSLGTLTDEGARALLKLPRDGKLKRLDLHRHFLSNAMMKQLKSLPFTINVTQQVKPEDWGDDEMRFVAIGE